jgi:hypothetical protein
MWLLYFIISLKREKSIWNGCGNYNRKSFLLFILFIYWGDVWLTIYTVFEIKISGIFEESVQNISRISKQPNYLGVEETQNSAKKWFAQKCYILYNFLTSLFK